ncbi:dimethylaniline monooxygenase [Cylindrospermum sp. NIES-4074]|nr:dimethylaniline monooxygenase [Cylindrospermum sp. NIES-4074]
MENKKICVIGAGISGLVTAKTFVEQGYEVTVFEKQAGLGGVWEKSRTYPGLSTQSIGKTYCFSDFPMPASYPEWPTAENIRNYLESYTRHFGISEKIRFQTNVTDVSRTTGSRPGWVVTVRVKYPHGNEIEEKHEFDFVVVCNGTASSTRLPSLPGKDEFTASGGQVLHSTEFNDTSIIEGKRVVVLGGGKSACDIATVAANQAQECSLVFRTPMWMLPKFFLGLVNMKYILLTRFSEVWFPYRQMRGAEKLLHTVGKPLVWAFWRLVELLVRLQLGLDSCGFVPQKRLNQIECSVAIAPQDFFKYIRSGKIQTIKTTITKFIPGGVELANGQQLQADIVILGTGFHQEIPFLEEKYRQQVVDKEGNFHLYRHLINPNIPQMGFVGYNATFFVPLSSEVGAWWLVEYVKGNLSLPSPSEMIQDTTAELDWMKNQFGFVADQGTCLVAFSLRYINQLIKDIYGTDELVVWKGLSQFMMPVDVSVYQKLRQKLNSQRLRNIDDSRRSETVGVRQN